MRFLKIIYPAILVCCLATAPAFASQLDDAQAAYNQQDYKTAFKLWQPLAELGDANAQYKLGMMYDYGYGVRKDSLQAIDWFRRAAVQGNAAAARHYEADNFALNLGLPKTAQAKASDRIAPSVADNSEKIPQKEAQQAASIEPAAGATTPLPPPIPLTAAASSVPDNQPTVVDAATVQTLTRLAAQGVAEAQRDLGILYQLGNGVPQDYGQATLWLTKAAAQGDIEAQERLGDLYAGGEFAAPQPTPATHSSPPLKAEQTSPPVVSRQQATPPPVPIAPEQPINLATQQGLDVGAEVSKYRYKEPSEDVDWGNKEGVEVGYTYVVAPDNWFMRGEGRYAGGPVDYSGSGTATGQPDNLWEVRAFEGKDFIFDNYSLSPYAGFGFRSLFNDARGLTSTGAAGYRRQSHYRYIPLGFTERYKMAGQVRLATNLEYDLFTAGTQESYFSDSNPATGNFVNHQNEGYGARGSVLFETMGWSAGPWFNYWHLQKSNQECDPGAGCGWEEPDNTTTELGLKIVKNFW